MKYQLVLQWPASSVKDYDDMIRLEEALTKEICHIALVDGHHGGSGQVTFSWKRMIRIGRLTGSNASWEAPTDLTSFSVT